MNSGASICSLNDLRLIEEFGNVIRTVGDGILEVIGKIILDIAKHAAKRTFTLIHRFEKWIGYTLRCLMNG